MSKRSAYQPDKKLVAVCGLFCPSCHIFIAQQEGPDQLRKIADRYQMSIEDVKCDGCRAEQRFSICKRCKMSVCANEKGIDFCIECDEYPCDILKEFQISRPHRIELWQAQARIHEVGYEKWFEEMLERYSCGQCDSINSAYDQCCRECGATPSCAYVDEHQAEIKAHLSN